MSDATPESDGGDDHESDGLRLPDGVMPVSRPLRRALDAASITSAACAAEVFSIDYERALVLIVELEVVLVGLSETRRWDILELDRVDGETILTRLGMPLPISAWDDADQGEAFRAQVRALLAQQGGCAVVGSGAPAPQSSGGTRVETVAIALGVLTAGVLGVMIALFAHGWWHIADNTGGALPPSPSGALKDGIALMPSGKNLYWLGPSAGGYRLFNTDLTNLDCDSPCPSIELRTGIEITYSRGSSDFLHVRTFAGPRRPPGGDDFETFLAAQGTPTDQAVVLTCQPTPSCPSPALTERLKQAVRPMTEADVDDLPDYWDTIPPS